MMRVSILFVAFSAIFGFVVATNVGTRTVTPSDTYRAWVGAYNGATFLELNPTTLFTFNSGVNKAAGSSAISEDPILITESDTGNGTRTVSITFTSIGDLLLSFDNYTDLVISVGKYDAGNNGLAYTSALGNYEVTAVVATANTNSSVFGTVNNANFVTGLPNDLGCFAVFPNAVNQGVLDVKCEWTILETAATTGALTSAAMTSSPLTSSPLTTAAMTSSPLTTSPLTTSAVTTAPFTTAAVPAVTTGGQATTAPEVTSGEDITSGSPITSGAQASTTGVQVIATSGDVPSSVSSSGEKTGISKGALAAAILIPVAIVLFIAILAILEFVRRRKQLKDEEKGAIEMKSPPASNKAASAKKEVSESSGSGSESESSSGSESKSKSSKSSKASKSESKTGSGSSSGSESSESESGSSKSSK